MVVKKANLGPCQYPATVTSAAGMICCSVAFGLFVPSILLTVFYANTNDKYIYDTERVCFVINTLIYNDTCSYSCNCYSCGTNTCCDRCYYTCYIGRWIVLVDNIQSYIDTSTAEKPLTVNKTLNTHQNATYHTCYSDGDDLSELKWRKDDDPHGYFAGMITLWSLIGLGIFSALILCVISIILWCLSESGTEDVGSSGDTNNNGPTCANKVDLNAPIPAEANV
jgi:hypothetical protein